MRSWAKNTLRSIVPRPSRAVNLWLLMLKRLSKIAIALASLAFTYLFFGEYLSPFKSTYPSTFGVITIP
jgi:hypothetical protein